jgi:hypothetical protein
MRGNRILHSQHDATGDGGCVSAGRRRRRRRKENKRKRGANGA